MTVKEEGNTGLHVIDTKIKHIAMIHLTVTFVHSQSTGRRKITGLMQIQTVISLTQKFFCGSRAICWLISASINKPIK